MLELTNRFPPRLPMLCFFSYSLKSFILYESKTIKPNDRRGIAGKNKKLDLSVSAIILSLFNPSDNSLEISPASFCNWVCVAETAKALAQRH